MVIPEDTDKIYQRSQGVRCEDITCFYKDCNRVFRMKAALTIHQQQLHRVITNAPLFACQKCGDAFKQEGSMKNHYKRCGGKELCMGRKNARNV